MKSNINKLILIEVIAGILFAFIASKIQHMTAALQIMYLPYELIGKGLRFLSLSSAIGNVIAIIIYAAISMIPAIYIIYQRKRGRTQKEENRKKVAKRNRQKEKENKHSTVDDMLAIVQRDITSEQFLVIKLVCALVGVILSMIISMRLHVGVNKFVLAMIFILFLTACIFTTWIYRSVVQPIKELRLATENIKSGNLDLLVTAASNDEMRQL